jgi:predicted nucleic acid-binding protein
MKARKRIVIDTNALVSRLLLPRSIPGQAVRKAVDEGVLLVSDATLNELVDVLVRPKFDPYLSIEERQDFKGFSAGSQNASQSCAPSRPAATRRTTSSWSLP